MPDITMCTGYDCVQKITCVRYTAIPNPNWQSWFVATPYNTPTLCDLYYEDIHRTGFGNNNQESDQQQGTPDVAGQPDSEDGLPTSRGGSGGDAPVSEHDSY